MTKTKNRYYAEFCETTTIPWVNPKVAWQVFDREHETYVDPQALCVCVTKDDATKIARALNEAESR